MYHYTSGENWTKIQRGGFLTPKTPPLSFEMRNSEKPEVARARELAKYPIYLVGVPTQITEKSRWTTSGLTPHLANWVKGEVLLELPILHEEAFVRDSFFVSPQYFNEHQIPDFWKFVQLDAMSPGEFRANDIWLPYYASTTPLREYKGDFKVPEIWTPQTTPISEIRKLEGTLLRLVA